MKTQDGFSLVELMVVMAMIGILGVFAVSVVSSWRGKHAMEGYIKEIYTMMMKARTSAATTNTPYLVTFATNQVQTGPDANGDNTIDTPETVNTGDYSLTNYVGTITFDRRGMTNNEQTIQLTSSSGLNPSLDCIVVSNTRINLGKWIGGNCVHQ